MNITLIHNADIYQPMHIGIKDILVVGNKIAAIGEGLYLGGIQMSEIDAGGKIAVPGFIDRHVHIIGGGGQQGFASLVPEVAMSELVACGTTTVVGMLGTDGFVKNLPSLYAKTQALCQDGLSAYMLTNYYGLPERTLTGSVAEDMIYVDKVIGCKLAMCDERSSFPTELEILRLLNQVKLGGFTSGKKGFLHIHLGDRPEGISLLLKIAHEHKALIPLISPTHMIRTEQLFNQSIELARMGGNVDYSTGGTKFSSPHECVMKALEKGVAIERITFSSDGHGGVRREDPCTGIITYRPAPLDLNFKEVRALVNECRLDLSEAIKLITSNPAYQMNLHGKGYIKEGCDADICFLDDKLNIVDVMARGSYCMRDNIINKKGRYES